MEQLDGVWSKEQVPNKQTQLAPQYVNYPKHFGLGDGLIFQDNSSSVAFAVQDVYNPNLSVPSDRRALFFSSSSSKDVHLIPCFDQIMGAHSAANMLGGSTHHAFNNLGFYNHLDMDRRSAVLGHVQAEKHDQFRSRGGYFDRIMAQPATRHFVDHHGCLQAVPTIRNMNSTYDHDDRLIKQILSRNFMAPSETACIAGSNGYRGEVWKDSATTSTAPKQMAPVKNTSKNSECIKLGQWSSEEDKLLVRLVEQHGVGKWSQIAKSLNGRKGKQCRDRWNNHLRPNIKKDIVWTDEEDKILIQAHMEYGNKWAVIAKRLPERSENSIKNHWNSTKRRQFAREISSSAKHRKPTTLLQNYIMGLGLPNPNSAQNGEGPTNVPSKPTKMGPRCRAGNVAPIKEEPVGHVDGEDWVLSDEMMLSLMPDDPPSLLSI